MTIPGGALWKVNAPATRWTYDDPSGSAGGITRAVVRDRSGVADGLVRFVVKGSGGSATLPDVDSVRTTVVLGAPGECASVDWNSPGGARPRCEGDGDSIRCK